MPQLAVLFFLLEWQTSLLVMTTLVFLYFLYYLIFQ
jgi:hypothetical protein